MKKFYSLVLLFGLLCPNFVFSEEQNTTIAQDQTIQSSDVQDESCENQVVSSNDETSQEVASKEVTPVAEDELIMITPVAATETKYPLQTSETVSKRQAKPPVAEEESEDIETPIGQVKGIRELLKKLVQRQDEVNNEIAEVVSLRDSLNELKIAIAEREKNKDDSLENIHTEIQDLATQSSTDNETLTNALAELEVNLKDSVGNVETTVNSNNSLIRDRLAAEIKEALSELEPDQFLPPYWRAVMVSVFIILALVIVSLLFDAIKGITIIVRAMKAYRDSLIRAEAAKLYQKNSANSTLNVASDAKFEAKTNSNNQLNLE